MTEPSREARADALLSTEHDERTHRLKIFLGAAPGVGKTYAMLSAARELKQQGVELRPSKSKEAKQVPLKTLPPERSEPIAFMVDALKNKKPIEGLVALDINVGVNEIIEAAKMSVKTGQAIKLPLKK